MGVLPTFVYAHHATPAELQGLHMGYASDREHWPCCGLGLRPSIFWVRGKSQDTLPTGIGQAQALLHPATMNRKIGSYRNYSCLGQEKKSKSQPWVGVSSKFKTSKQILMPTG